MMASTARYLMHSAALAELQGRYDRSAAAARHVTLADCEEIAARHTEDPNDLPGLVVFLVNAERDGLLDADHAINVATVEGIAIDRGDTIDMQVYIGPHIAFALNDQPKDSFPAGLDDAAGYVLKQFARRLNEVLQPEDQS